MILCCAHCESPIRPGYDSDMFCSARCAHLFEEEMKRDAGIDDGYHLGDW
jgi:predicted nucleic acid-binding Zn ribbon protein